LSLKLRKLSSLLKISTAFLCVYVQNITIKLALELTQFVMEIFLTL